MALIKWTGHDLWEPFGELGKIQDEINRIFSREAAPGAGVKAGNGSAWIPRVDIIEEKDRILVTADLPGLKQEEISVEVEGDLLTIKGERKHAYEKTEDKVYRVERSYGSFLRSFSLPSNVDGAKVSAACKNGVLEVILPKRDEAKPKQVKVEVK